MLFPTAAVLALVTAAEVTEARPDVEATPVDEATIASIVEPLVTDKAPLVETDVAVATVVVEAVDVKVETLNAAPFTTNVPPITPAAGLTFSGRRYQ